uniref:Uncharacterized protein n=1 Tax=Knipowitschia caucasica TaxID=637954 RepID=A0AAV2L7W5_KNICA
MTVTLCNCFVRPPPQKNEFKQKRPPTCHSAAASSIFMPSADFTCQRGFISAMLLTPFTKSANEQECERIIGPLRQLSRQGGSVIGRLLFAANDAPPIGQ